MNLVEIAGHLGADPETRVTPNGIKITTLRLATNSRRAGKDETIWWRVTIFGDRFDKMLVHVRKGSALIVLGELNKPEIWMDKEGRPQITLEVVAEMLRFSPFGKSERQEGGSQPYGASQQNSGYSSAPSQQSSGYGTQSSHQESSYGDSHYQSPGQSYTAHSPSGGASHSDDELPF